MKQLNMIYMIYLIFPNMGMFKLTKLLHIALIHHHLKLMKKKIVIFRMKMVM